MNKPAAVLAAIIVLLCGVIIYAHAFA